MKGVTEYSLTYLAPVDARVAAPRAARILTHGGGRGQQRRHIRNGPLLVPHLSVGVAGVAGVAGCTLRVSSKGGLPLVVAHLRVRHGHVRRTLGV